MEQILFGLGHDTADSRQTELPKGDLVFGAGHAAVGGLVEVDMQFGKGGTGEVTEQVNDDDDSSGEHTTPEASVVDGTVEIDPVGRVGEGLGVAQTTVLET